MTTPTNFWSPLLDRLNYVCIGIHYILFEDPIDPEKDKKMNLLWRIFFENIKLINLQVRNKRLDPKKVSLSQEKNLKKHKEFFLFWFKDLIPKLGPDTELEKVIKFIQENFEKIYGSNHVYWLLKLSKQNKIEPQSRPKLNDRLSTSVNIKPVKRPKKSVENSFEIDQEEPIKRRMSLRRIDEDTNKTTPKSEDDNTHVETSMIVSKSILNKYQTPVKENLKMVKEEQSMTTDSEIEEFQKSVNKFKNKKPVPTGNKFIGDNLELNKTETSQRYSK